MVRWSGAAYRDLKGVFDFIARDSRHYARHVVETILAKASDIEPFPARGRVVPELGDERVREIFVFSYRLIYEGRDDGATVVLAVIHGRRELPDIRRPDR